jgi:outer membrane protein assembly factor BamB
MLKSPVYLICAAVAASGQLEVAAPWPMAGGNNLRNGKSAFVGPRVAPGPNQGTVGVLWQWAPPKLPLSSYPPYVTFSSSPAVAADGGIWASSGAGTLYCIDPVTGKERSNTNLAQNYEASPPTLGQGLVVVGSKGMNMWAINATHTFTKGTNTIGVQLWQVTTASDGYDVSSAAIGAGNIAYVGLGEGSVIAVNAVTAARVWSFSTGTNHRVAMPALDESIGTLFVTTSEGTLWAIGATTGALLWNRTLLGSTFSGPVLSAPGGTIFVGTSYGVQAFNTAGTPLWSHATARSVGPAPAVDPVAGTVYAAAWDSNVYALNAATGALQWTFFAGGLALASSPVVDAEGVVYIGSNVAFWALTGATGVPLWSIVDFPGLVFSPAAIGANGTLYVGFATTGGAPAGCIAAVGAAFTLSARVPAV